MADQFLLRQIESPRAFTSCETTGKCLHPAFEPAPVELSQKNFPIHQPALGLGTARGVLVTPANSRSLRHRAKQLRFRMHEEETAAVTAFRHGNEALAAITGVEHANLSLMHERVSLHELQQVGLDVRADDAVRFDDGARFGINVVPRTPDL